MKSLSDLGRFFRVRFEGRCCRRWCCKSCELEDLWGGEDEKDDFELSILGWTMRCSWVEAMTCLRGSDRLLGQMIVQAIGYATTFYSPTLPSLCAASKKIAGIE